MVADNAARYTFSDFTLHNYKKLLQLALENYSFKLFDEDYFPRSILLRHDIEFSVPNALRMANIEASLGIKSTYFVQLHSEFYNALEKAMIETIYEIIRLGHRIGLHFDVHYWNIQREEELEEYIQIDKKTLEEYTGMEIKVFSFHNNNGFTMSCRRDQYAGLLNVYSDYFRENYAYNADSLGYWRYERLEDRLREAKEDALQILIHDGMWQDAVLPPRRRVFKVIDDNAERLKNYYDDFLKNAGVKNIDW
jgi:hypothetical protein